MNKVLFIAACSLQLILRCEASNYSEHVGAERMAFLNKVQSFKRRIDFDRIMHEAYFKSDSVYKNMILELANKIICKEEVDENIKLSVLKNMLNDVDHRLSPRKRESERLVNTVTSQIECEQIHTMLIEILNVIK